jgi:hypothetical protein
MKTISVKQNEEKPVPVEVIAESIVAISSGIKKLLKGPLNERALILLIQDAAPAVGRFKSKPVSQADIKAVITGIESLEETFLKPKGGKA